MPLSWDAALRCSGVIDVVLSHRIRKNYLRRLSRCHLTGKILIAAASSLHPDGRPGKANTENTGSSGEHFCCISISTTLSQVS